MYVERTLADGASHDYTVAIEPIDSSRQPLK